jgi:hypothetical protein
LHGVPSQVGCIRPLDCKIANRLWRSAASRELISVEPFQFEKFPNFIPRQSSRCNVNYRFAGPASHPGHGWHVPNPILCGLPLSLRHLLVDLRLNLRDEAGMSLAELLGVREERALDVLWPCVVEVIIDPMRYYRIQIIVSLRTLGAAACELIFPPLPFHELVDLDGAGWA